ncbi:hypothetical protein CGH21_23095, partial [Vibrio parahaemolyticus]
LGDKPPDDFYKQITNAEDLSFVPDELANIFADDESLCSLNSGLAELEIGTYITMRETGLQIKGTGGYLISAYYGVVSE